MFSSETRTFYRSLFNIVTPIALQNLISAAVNSADVVMLGYVGQTALASASLASQVQIVLLLFFVGMASGLIMLTAQYWGKGDTQSIETLTGIAFKFSCTAGLVFFLAAFFFPSFLMRIFTNDSAMIHEGAKYLKIVAPSYFFMSISQVFQAVFKSIERVKTVTALTIGALLLNIVLNAVFIFGAGPIPALEIRGAALATTVARLIEVLACFFVASRIKDIRLVPSILLMKNKVLSRDFFRFALPALGNEFVWGAAFAMYSSFWGIWARASSRQTPSWAWYGILPQCCALAWHMAAQSCWEKKWGAATWKKQSTTHLFCGEAPCLPGFLQESSSSSPIQSCSTLRG